jgi:hypothetical protein
MRAKTAPLVALTALMLTGSTALAAGPTRGDYRYFRALSIDLKGRVPSPEELASFEKPGFDLDGYVDQALSGPQAAERIRRVYTDLLRLSVGKSFQFVPGRATLRVQKVKDASGNTVQVLFRQGQRRADALTDGEFCFPKEITGQTYPSNTAAKDDPAQGGAKGVPQAEIDKRTVLVKPWWLYRDHASAQPKLSPDDWGADFALTKGLTQDDAGAPITQVRVCKEEAATAPMGVVYASGLTKKPDAIPAGRFTFPPTDSSYAQKNPGAPIDCRVGSALSLSADCGCGPGLERCNPATTEGFESSAFNFPTQTPLGPDDGFDQSDQPTSSWLRYWWGQEAVQMLDHAAGDDVDFREVLTGKATWVNGPLAQFYREIAPATCCGQGVNFGYVSPEPLLDPKALPALSPHDATKWQKVADRGARASGLLTTPIFLTKYGSRRARAHVLYTAFLCKEFVAENLQLAPSTEADLTKRPGCSACHQGLEPMAAYFSRVQESDWTYLPAAQFPLVNTTCKLDSKGKLSSSCSPYYDPAFTDDSGAKLRGAYVSSEHAEAGPRGLGEEIAGSPLFASCVAQNVASSFLGRTLTDDDDGLRDQLAKQLEQSNFRVKAMVKALVKSDAYRKANNLTADAWREEVGP